QISYFEFHMGNAAWLVNGYRLKRAGHIGLMQHLLILAHKPDVIMLHSGDVYSEEKSCVFMLAGYVRLSSQEGPGK
ncbi:hypothetical protein C4544_00685, partial [candidate division WS5 bacterium]